MAKPKAVKKYQNVFVKPKGPRALAAVLPKVAEPTLRERGFAAAEIITHWLLILGPTLARQCIPERVSYPKSNQNERVLFIRTSGSAALEIQHQIPIIIERINTYFGFKAVTKISIVQSQLLIKPKIQPKEVRNVVNKQSTLKIEADLTKIETKELNHALKRLAKTIELHRSKKK
ncbi:MAG: DciA family protein [Pseudomonadota bacterium]|nr:DciA family protein [Pseudomonadota bacterium]